jgi:UDP-glucose 4-epimerase
VPRFINQALRSEPITVYGDGRQTRCFTYVGDVVRSLIALSQCQTAWGEVFNIGREEETSIDDLAALVAELVGSSSEITHVPYEVAYQRGYEDMRRRVPDVSKLRRVIGYAPDTRLEESLRKIIDFQMAAAPRGR